MREPEVDERDIRLPRPKPLQTLFSISCLLDEMPVQLQQTSQGLSCIGLVLDDEDSLPRDADDVGPGVGHIADECGGQLHGKLAPGSGALAACLDGSP